MAKHRFSEILSEEILFKTDYLYDIIEYEIVDIKNYSDKEIIDKKLPILGLKLIIKLKYKSYYNKEIKEIENEYTYITTNQFYDYIEELRNNKIKGIRLEKYFIGNINTNSISNNFISDKFKLLTKKISNMKLDLIESNIHENNINEDIILIDNIFTEGIRFSNLNKYNILFLRNIFKEYVEFDNNNLNYIKFLENNFNSRFEFNKNNIKEHIEFICCEFSYSKFYENKYEDNVRFEKCVFLSNLNMNNEIYIKDVIFKQITAYGQVNLDYSEYNKYVLFKSGQYNKGINIHRVVFNSQVTFYRSTIEQNLSLNKVKLRAELDLKHINNKILLIITECQLDSVLYINEESILGIKLIRLINNGRIEVNNIKYKGKRLIDKCINIHQNEFDTLTNKLYKQTEYTESEIEDIYIHLKNSKEEIKETLLLLRDNFKKICREEIEDNFYYEYKRFDIRPYYHTIHRRKNTSKKLENILDFIENYKKNKFFYKHKGKKSDFIKFINQYIFEIVGGFGTNPKSIFISIIIIIFIFGLIYYSFGISQFVGLQDYNVTVDINEVQTMNLRFYGEELTSYIKLPLIAAMYFSFITFLGNVNVWNEVIALIVSVEVILGVVLIGYLTLAIMRKIIR